MDALYRFAYRLTGNASEAEDLVQETYLRAWRFFHTFRPGSNCRSWLFRIMRNLQVSAWQSRRRAPVQASLEETDEHFLYRKTKSLGVLPEQSPELLYLATRAPEMRQALEQLPEEYRAAVLLCDVEGFTYAEIAEILDIPIGTVRSRLSRGRARLQKLLWDYVLRERPDLAVREAATAGRPGPGEEP